MSEKVSKVSNEISSSSNIEIRFQIFTSIEDGLTVKNGFLVNFLFVCKDFSRLPVIVTGPDYSLKKI